MSTRFKRFVLFILFLGLLAGAGTTLRPLQGMRMEYHLSYEPARGLTPELALATQVLGWGRGLIIDVIWVRMEGLKQKERFFELVQLADWACKLAPRFPQVWDIQSWNLAYNVSCKVTFLPDRWAWVNSAIELLRAEGIPQNPYSAMLYDRLGWIYFHKIGEQTDNANLFYKQKFALMMHEVLGGEGDEETLKALIATPRTRFELEKDPGVKALVAECAPYSYDIVDGYWGYYNNSPSLPPAVKEIAERPYYEAALDLVAIYARAKRLREEFKLDPERMLALRDKYGPFDWRSAYPHAVYWAELGLERLSDLERRTIAKYERFGVDYQAIRDQRRSQNVGQGEGLFEFRRVMLKRIVYYSMQSMVLQGRLVFDTKGRLMLDAGSDYRFADATLPLFEDVIKNDSERYKRSAADGLLNFLKRGIVEFYYMAEAGDQTKLQKAYSYYEMLKKKYPAEVRKRSFEGYVQSLEDWFLEDMTTSEAKRVVAATIQRAFYAYGCNADDKASVLWLKAKRQAEQWNKQESGGTLRSSIRYEVLRENVLIDVFTGRAGFPRQVAANLEKRLRAELSDDVVGRVLANLDRLRKQKPEAEDVDEKLKQESY